MQAWDCVKLIKERGAGYARSKCCTVCAAQRVIFEADPQHFFRP
jgi:hypothetical protein